MSLLHDLIKGHSLGPDERVNFNKKHRKEISKEMELAMTTGRLRLLRYVEAVINSNSMYDSRISVTWWYWTHLRTICFLAPVKDMYL